MQSTRDMGHQAVQLKKNTQKSDAQESEMVLRKIIVPTLIAHSGMPVGEIFRECCDKGVPGVPYQGEDGELVGRISMRHIFRQVCVQPDVIDAAHMLGDQTEHLDLPDVERCKILDLSAEQFLLKNMPMLTLSSPLVKAVAIMEKYNSSYLFVVDSGLYRGTVTRFGITRLLLENCGL